VSGASGDDCHEGADDAGVDDTGVVLEDDELSRVLGAADHAEAAGVVDGVGAVGAKAVDAAGAAGAKAADAAGAAAAADIAAPDVDAAGDELIDASA